MISRWRVLTIAQVLLHFIGTPSRVLFLDAVQAMSVAAHCGEMDDIHSGAGTCIGGMVVPALIAMAENMAAARDFS
jgi:2-methylcitrate dehydratase PrpD